MAVSCPPHLIAHARSHASRRPAGHSPALESLPTPHPQYSARLLPVVVTVQVEPQPNRNSCQTGAGIAMSSSCSRSSRMTLLDGFGRSGSEIMLVSSRYFMIHSRTSRPGVPSRVPANRSSGSSASSARALSFVKSRYAAVKLRRFEERRSKRRTPIKTATGSPRRVNATSMPFSASRTSRGRLRLASAIECLSVIASPVMYLNMYIIPKALW